VDLTGAILTHADLTGAYLGDADLTCATWHKNVPPQRDGSVDHARVSLDGPTENSEDTGTRVPPLPSRQRGSEPRRASCADLRPRLELVQEQLHDAPLSSSPKPERHCAVNLEERVIGRPDGDLKTAEL
jgi:pentapeptide repeat protein